MFITILTKRLKLNVPFLGSTFFGSVLGYSVWCYFWSTGRSLASDCYRFVVKIWYRSRKQVSKKPQRSQRWKQRCSPVPGGSRSHALTRLGFSASVGSARWQLWIGRSVLVGREAPARGFYCKFRKIPRGWTAKRRVKDCYPIGTCHQPSLGWLWKMFARIGRILSWLLSIWALWKVWARCEGSILCILRI